MAFVIPKESFSGQVLNPSFGEGDKAITVGGEKVLPFLDFEGEIPNRPAIALEIQDIPPTDWPETIKKIYESVADDPVK